MNSLSQMIIIWGRKRERESQRAPTLPLSSAHTIRYVQSSSMLSFITSSSSFEMLVLSLQWAIKKTKFEPPLLRSSERKSWWCLINSHTHRPSMRKIAIPITISWCDFFTRKRVAPISHLISIIIIIINMHIIVPLLCVCACVCIMSLHFICSTLPLHLSLLISNNLPGFETHIITHTVCAVDCLFYVLTAPQRNSINPFSSFLPHDDSKRPFTRWALCVSVCELIIIIITDCFCVLI